MKRAWLVVIAIGCGSSTSQTPEVSRQPPPPPPEVVAPAFDPPRPTLRLPRHFAPTRYTARLAIDPAKPTFEGNIVIDGNLDRRSSVIWLHGKSLDVTSAKASDGTHEITLAVKAEGELLELRPAHPLDAGHWTLDLAYRGKIQDNAPDGAYLSKYGSDRYIVTQFEATAARLVFPCIDEPDRKVPWQLTLDVPKDQVAVSNTLPTGTVALDATHERIAYAITRPLPSYLVAFSVGPYDVISAGTAKSGLALRVLTPRGTTKKAEYLVSSLPRIIDILEEWFAIPFPYPKLDIVVASRMAGAMENAGMITSEASALLFDNPGARDRYNLVSLIGHESAHQWFGDLVTAAWWDDIWLNESFATWMEDKVLLAFDKTWPAEATQHRMQGFGADELLTARKIRQPIEAVGDIQNAFDSITYPKGGTVLRMLEHVIGEAAFRTAIQHYVTSHADGNATADDLFAALDSAGKPLGAMVTGWFDQPGVPEVGMTLSCDGGKAQIALSQTRFLPTQATAPPELWTIPVCVAYEGPKHARAEACTVLAAATGVLELPSCPAWFAPAGDYGYYRARLDAKALETIRDKAWSSLTVDEHVAIYSDAQSFAMRGSLPFGLFGSLTTMLGRSHELREVSAALGDSSEWGGPVPGLPGKVIAAVPLDLVPRARAKARAIAEPLAAKYGLVATATDPLLVAKLRSNVLGAVVWTRSHVLDARAKQLAAHYHDLTPDMMTAALQLAANADPKVVAQLRTDLTKERDTSVRWILLGVLGTVTDPVQHHAMLESLATDPALGPDEFSRIWVTFDGEEQRADVEAYERAHLAEIMKRLPMSENEIFPLAVFAAYPFVSACDPARRDEITTFVTTHFSALPSAARPIKQFLEQMDDCIARKKLLEPTLRAWLTGKP
jgi:cytosol alanyl aminopeptidase